jgi:hypothetical protein
LGGAASMAAATAPSAAPAAAAGARRLHKHRLRVQAMAACAGLQPWKGLTPGRHAEAGTRTRPQSRCTAAAAVHLRHPAAGPQPRILPYCRCCAALGRPPRPRPGKPPPPPTAGESPAPRRSCWQRRRRCLPS